MDNDKILLMEQALEAIGIKTKQDDKYRMFDDVMCDLHEKWHSLEQHDNQRVANAFVRCML